MCALQTKSPATAIRVLTYLRKKPSNPPAHSQTSAVPQKNVKGWFWQSDWRTQAAFCWPLLPIAGAFLTVPDYWQVLQSAPREAMQRSFLLGAACGIGSTAFADTGTNIDQFLDKAGANWVLFGILVGVVGVVICGFAGRWKERDRLTWKLRERASHWND